MEAFCFKSILFFVAEHELALVSECGKKLHCGGGGPPIALRLGCLQCSGNGSVVGVEGERVGCWHGVVAVACEMDCEYWFLLALGDSFSSGALV